MVASVGSGADGTDERHPPYTHHPAGGYSDLVSPVPLVAESVSKLHSSMNVDWWEPAS